MKQILIIGLVIFATAFIYAQADNQNPQEVIGGSMPVNETGTLDMESSTSFVVDLSDGSTGLETKVGLEVIFELFAENNRGVISKNTTDPTVRILMENAAFTWWNTYAVEGGNLEQNDFNNGISAQPLTLTFDSLITDVVWQNFYFRVAGTKPKMQVDSVALKSIFDEVMEASDSRWYVKEAKALYYQERYNSLQLPLLKRYLISDILNTDLSTQMAGQLGCGMAIQLLEIDFLAGSYLTGVDNNDNHWAFSLDANLYPVKGMKIGAEGLASIYISPQQPSAAQNLIAFGVSAEYLLPLTDMMILKPFGGFDGSYVLETSELNWEAGGGAFLYLRGMDYTTSHRSVDRDEVIPVGLSVSANIDQDLTANLLFGLFEEASEESLIPNLGGFAQVELANLIPDTGEYIDPAVSVQLEYLIMDMFLPYVREQFSQEIIEVTGQEFDYYKTDYNQYNSVAGVLITPMDNFSLDLWYERTDKVSANDILLDNGVIGLEFNISM